MLASVSSKGDEGTFIDDHMYVCVGGVSELADMAKVLFFKSVMAMMLEFVPDAQVSIAHTPEDAELFFDGDKRWFMYVVASIFGLKTYTLTATVGRASGSYIVAVSRTVSDARPSVHCCCMCVARDYKHSYYLLFQSTPGSGSTSGKGVCHVS